MKYKIWKFFFPFCIRTHPSITVTLTSFLFNQDLCFCFFFNNCIKYSAIFSFFSRTPENVFRRHLRKCNISRSPGGTPLTRTKDFSVSMGEGLTPMLSNALKKKFNVSLVVVHTYIHVVVFVSNWNSKVRLKDAYEKYLFRLNICLCYA